MPAPAAALCHLGVDPAAALALAARHSPERVSAVVGAAPRRASRNAAGWAIRALGGGWTISHPTTPACAAAPGWHQPADGPGAGDTTAAEMTACWQAWDHAVSAALDAATPPALATLAETTLPRPPDVEVAGPRLRERLTGLDPTTDHLAKKKVACRDPALRSKGLLGKRDQRPAQSRRVMVSGPEAWRPIGGSAVAAILCQVRRRAWEW